MQLLPINTLEKMSNTLRFLSCDMVQNASSGHPGAPMGLSDIAVVLSHHIRLNPKSPSWLNRDRLVFSGGHCSALLYSLLHLWGFDLSLEDLKNFRTLNSKTPGHPEYGHTQGVEITTGPLGQGVANSVGFAMASRYASEILGEEVINHKVYCFCGDGDLQEGISYEAVSIAGHYALENLILIYDSNNITIEGDLSISMSENVRDRFTAQGWEVFECDGHNFEMINTALICAKNSKKPSIIIAKTTIAKNAFSLEGSHKTHGAPLGEDIISKSKAPLGFTQKFEIPQIVADAFKSFMDSNIRLQEQWEEIAKQKTHLIDELKNPDFTKITYPDFEVGTSIATRVSNGKILNSIAKSIKGFIGGSADLAPSNNTTLEGMGDFPFGKNLHFGIREHSMGAICNGIANYGLFLPFCATFFVFSDYLSPSIRVASIMNSKVFYVFTHDSIGVGEDGATHQPIEHLTHLRAMPNLKVFRPADANENIACFQVALQSDGPSAFILSRQNLEVLQPCSKQNVSLGGYVLVEDKDADITLLASGSEVHLALKCLQELKAHSIKARVVSLPCYDLLAKQPSSYIKTLFPEHIKTLAIEASSGIELYRFADEVVAMDSFGLSGKGEDLFAHFGFTPNAIIQKIKQILG